ncbi:MAG TPA: TIM barrel protein [Chitinophagaceae bacterium]|nr:TIM barrel protein [Chitinophagaceae bacterium]
MAQPTSRRTFLLQSALAGTGLLLSRDLFAFQPKPKSVFGGVQIGAITYSFRSMPGSIEDLIKYCTTCGISAVELMGDAAEAWAGSPAGLMPPMAPPPPGQQMVFTEEQRAAMRERNQKAKGWRETVSMDKFVELKKLLDKAGISVYAYKPNALGENNSDAEIEYAMKAAKALGANSVTVELPNKPEQSRRLGEFGSKHKVYVGYHAHTQATDTLWDQALAQSPYNSMNLDCGHYIAAGGNNTTASLLALIEAKHDRITSMHLKDRKTKANGGENVEWGKGDTPIKDILTLLKKKKYKIPVSIELEYDIPQGSDAVKEVAKCVAYAKAILA